MRALRVIIIIIIVGRRKVSGRVVKIITGFSTLRRGFILPTLTVIILIIARIILVGVIVLVNIFNVIMPDCNKAAIKYINI